VTSPLRTSVHIQFRAERNSGGSVYRVVPVGVTQGKPKKLTGDTIAVRLIVELPRAAFEPFSADATVIVPAELVQHGVTAEASE
jgi:hypothetical protein